MELLTGMTGCFSERYYETESKGFVSRRKDRRDVIKLKFNIGRHISSSDSLPTLFKRAQDHRLLKDFLLNNLFIFVHSILDACRDRMCQSNIVCFVDFLFAVKLLFYFFVTFLVLVFVSRCTMDAEPGPSIKKNVLLQLKKDNDIICLYPKILWS